MKHLIFLSLLFIGCQEKKGSAAVLKASAPTDCVCPEIWSPQCGADGKTYGNKCEADCVGIEVASEGACE